MRQRLLEFLRVPEKPEPPPGAGANLETFRASRRYLYYSVLGWALKQAGALAGLVFSLAFFGLGQPFVDIEKWDFFNKAIPDVRFRFVPFSLDLPHVLRFLEILAVVVWGVQFILSGLLLKLSWELRWYMVGETSLRIRRGLWSMREQTMTIANIQNMVVHQGPLQRLFGISDLEVHTAGGGRSSDGDKADPSSDKHSFHIGRFRGLEDAAGLRDRIRARVSNLTLAPPKTVDPQPVEDSGFEELLSAARELSREARALRLAQTGPEAPA